MLRRNFLFGLLLAPAAPALAKLPASDDFSLESVSVVARSRVLKAEYTMELPVWYELHGGVSWTHDWDWDGFPDQSTMKYPLTGITDQGVSIVTKVQSRDNKHTTFLRDRNGDHSSCGSGFFRDNAYRLEPGEAGVEIPAYWEPRTEAGPYSATYLKHQAKVKAQRISRTNELISEHSEIRRYVPTC